MWRTRLTQAAALGLLGALASLSFSVVRPSGFRALDATRSEPRLAQPATAVARRMPAVTAPLVVAEPAPVTSAPALSPAPSASPPPGDNAAPVAVDRSTPERSPEAPAPRPGLSHRLVGRFGWAIDRSACSPPDLEDKAVGKAPALPKEDREQAAGNCPERPKVSHP